MRVRWSTLSWSAYITASASMIVALALGLGADALALGDRGGALGEIFRRRAGRGDSTAGSARCPNRRCRIRDRPSAHPRIRFARRGTRTNADTAWRGRKASALPACTMSRNAPCRALFVVVPERRLRQRNAGRKRHRNCKDCSHRGFSLLPLRIKQRVSNCPIGKVARSPNLTAQARSRQAGSHKRETGFLWEAVLTFEGGEKHAGSDTYVRTLSS